MHRICRIVIPFVIAGTAVSALACGPGPREHYAKTEKRVRERFEGVDSVVLVTLLDVAMAKKIDMGIELQGEKSTFRIDRVFKGHARPGDKLILNTFSTCANYVVEKWNGAKGPAISSRQWLLYRNHSDTQMPAHDMAQPIDIAAYDVNVLSNRLSAHANKHR